jgi:hypothetical protein
VFPPLVGVGVCSRIEKAQARESCQAGNSVEGFRAGLYGAYLSMEGTLGAADCVFLRGRTPEAALMGHACVVRLRRARGVCLLVGHTGVGGISCHSLQRVCDRRCSSRSGWGEASVLSDQGGGSMAGIAESCLWPVKSRLTCLARGIVTRLSSAVFSGHTGNAARGVRPFQRLCRGSFRLQKLTSSAWPSRPRVKNPGIRGWSSLEVRKHSRGERALEASLPVAKPQAWWRVPSGALVDGRYVGAWKVALVDVSVNGKALAASWNSVSELREVGQDVPEAKSNNLARG